MYDLLVDLWGFMRERKKFWLAPIIIVMVLLGIPFALQHLKLAVLALFPFGRSVVEAR